MRFLAKYIIIFITSWASWQPTAAAQTPCEWRGDSFRASLPLETFLFYTPKPARDFFKKSEYLTISATLERYQNRIWLRLRIVIADGSPKFGNIEPLGLLSLVSLKGDVLEMRSPKGATPVLENDQTIYDVLFELPVSAIRFLRKHELTSIKIVFSEGFQEYDVYDVSFMQNLMQCAD